MENTLEKETAKMQREQERQRAITERLRDVALVLKGFGLSKNQQGIVLALVREFALEVVRNPRGNL